MWPPGTPVHNALQVALTAAGRVQPPHCVESNSSILNLTLLNNTDLLGVASHRAARRFEQLNAIRILPMRLEGQGAVSMYGADLRTLDRAEFRAQLGYVEQDAPVLAGTLRDNLRLGAPDASDAACERVLRAVNLGDLIDRSAAHAGLDSGLDVDALRDCSRRVEAATTETGLGVLAITHYTRLLTELKPDVVHILVKGRIRATGGPELADELEEHGYAKYLPEGESIADDTVAPDAFAADPFAAVVNAAT